MEIKNGLRILYLNARSILSKIKDLEATASDVKPDLILITESWCNSDISDNVLKLSGYELASDLRKDRTDTANGIGGGLLIYSRIGLEILPVDSDSDFNQYVNFKVVTASSTLNVILIYRSPNSSVVNNSKLTSIIENAPTNTMVIGDMNYPNVDWVSMTSDNIGRDFMNACLDSNFSQLVNFATHRRNNILDLVLCNDDSVLHIDNLGPLSNSDHVMLLIETSHGIRVPDEGRVLLDWKKANNENIAKELQDCNWRELLSMDGVENKWKALHRKIQDTVERNVPKRTIINKGEPYWMNRYIKRLRRKKSRQYKKMKNTQSLADIENYKKTDKELRKAIRNAKRRIEIKISKDRGNEGQRKFNRYVKTKMSKTTGIGPLINDQKELVCDDAQKADILNTYFSSVFTVDPGDDYVIPDMDFSEELTDFAVIAKEVKDAIDDIKWNKASGPDDINPNFVKKFRDYLIEPLCLILRESLDSGEIPQDWKNASVIPIFKKGSKGEPSNYRPVSLTCIVSKVYERIMRKKITEHLTTNNLIRPSQHGFMKSRSCQTNLLEFLDCVTEMIDNGDAVDIIYLDYSKAFDKISHCKLIKKLQAHGIKGKVLNWIKEWLKGRKQWVVINGNRSDIREVTSGVPQGSVLGPLLFIIYINDIDIEVVEIDTLKKFADDTKGAKRIVSDEDHKTLQEALNKLSNWSEKWKMDFNVKKCKVMHCGRQNPRKTYMIGNEEISKVEEERDIGVLITSNLKPTRQCQDAANKARQVLGQISRCFHYRDKSVFLRLYKQYVRPHLEFSSCVWSPWNLGDIDLLEDVQKRAIRMISGLTAQTYEGKLKELNLWTLKKRREMQDLIQVFKILNNIGNVSMTWNTVGNSATNTIFTRSHAHPLNIIPKRCNLEVRRNFFTNRVVTGWNALPPQIKTTTDLKKFRKQITDHLNQRD